MMETIKLLHFTKFKFLLPTLYVGRILTREEATCLLHAFYFLSVPLSLQTSSWCSLCHKHFNDGCESAPFELEHLQKLEEIYDYKYKSYYKQPVSLESYM